MTIEIVNTAENRLSWSSVFGPAGECVIILERWTNPGGQTRSVAAAIMLGSLPMTRLAYYSQPDEHVVAIWGAVVTPNLTGTNYSMTRTAGSSALTDRFDVLILSGVSSDMLVASHQIRLNVATSTTYSHTIATKYGGIVIDQLQASGGAPHAGQNWCFSATYKSSYKSDINSGTTTMGWNWSASRAVYACASLRPKETNGGVMGIL